MEGKYGCRGCMPVMSSSITSLDLLRARRLQRTKYFSPTTPTLLRPMLSSANFDELNDKGMFSGGSHWDGANVGGYLQCVVLSVYINIIRRTGICI